MAHVKTYQLTLLDKGVVFTEQDIRQQRYVNHKSFSDFEKQEMKKEFKRKQSK